MTGLEGLLAGRLLGERYRIEEVIGRGGMGAVYRARDERLGREVAVKVITMTGTPDAEARERLRARFLREARSAAALPHHPNVVPVYDYGTDAALGLDYIVMELLRGNDLANRFARSQAPPLAVGIKVLTEAARGVAVGHRAGLIHRDVKPGNLFLAEHHGEVQVRVLDFGIAKLADEDDTLAQLTQDGRVPHSPAFASPEQLRGLSQLTAASDVFSLGAVGYQLLTGERPFSDADRNRMSLGMPVDPPSLREHNPAIPGSVEAVIRRALAHDPADRFPDAGAMAVALGGALQAVPDAPLEPYAIGAAAAPGPAEDDDRTRILPAGGDDGTLIAEIPPREPPPSRRGPAAPPRGLPPRPAPAERRGWGGRVVWAVVLLVLGAAAAAIWLQTADRRLVAVVDPDTAEIPPAPDTLPVLTPDATVAETIGGSTGLDAFMYNEEGRRMYEARDYAGALERFELAAALSPEDANFRYNRALALFRLGEAERAVDEFRGVIALDPRRAGAYYYLGLASLQVGDTTAAWTALQRTAEISDVAVERAAALREIRAIERTRAAPQPPPIDTTAPVPVVPPPPVRGADTMQVSPPARADTAARRDTARAAARDTVRGEGG